MKIHILSLLFLLFNFARAEDRKYVLCIPESNIIDCRAVERGESRVKCLAVVDNAECAIRLASGEADFGVFQSEDMLLTYQFYPSTIVPIFQLRHMDKTDAEFEYESVVIVPSDYNSTVNNLGKGFDGLINSGLCHPGFSREQWWNDYTLKYVERKMYNYTCSDDKSVVENELLNIKNFYGKACRPGPWVDDDSLDQELKQQYPELCSLCDDPTTCKYSNRDKHGHYGALDCLTSNRGKIAYVALTHARNYLKSNDSYQFLCVDGSTQPLSTNAPCTWISQPWKAIVARKDISNSLTKDLSQWLTTAANYISDPWEIPLKKVLCGHDYVPKIIDENTSLSAYLGRGRTVDFPNLKTCGKSIGWCTVNKIENTKCEWIAKEALILGIEPKISCKPAKSTFQCFRDISTNKADIITIDSNYGHLARSVYNLKTLLYSETDNNKNSMVLAVVRKQSSSSEISSLQSLEGKKACFPEYGGIAWLSFINIARTNGLFDSDSCDYPQLVSNFFSGACTPGWHDEDHSNHTEDSTDDKSLCSVCPLDPTNSTTTCAASSKNRYYADKGALKCLSDGAGDVAFVEAGNLNEDSSINPNDYHVLCKNGSLSARPGFYFDDLCAFSVTIDSEVVSRRDGSNIEEQDEIHVLAQLQRWLGYRVGSQRPIHIYRKFNNTKDLLFKDSTSGLVSTNSELKSVLAYKELFSHVEACSAGVTLTVVNYLLVAVVVVLSTLHYG